MIANKYNLLEKINEGSFGIVFKGENKRTKELVAIKFETKMEDVKSLKNEAKIYQYLGNLGLNFFPKLKMFGTIGNQNYLVMDLLGNSLEHTITHYKALCMKTVLLLGVQIIRIIKILHENCLIHRDIKPSNFVFGNNSNKLYLIDFGFVKRYDFNGKHIEQKNIKNIIGSPNFVSLNVHNKIEPSRRDDVESCIYIILTMLFGKLEWFDKQNIDDINELKQNVVYVEEVPSFIKIMIYYIRTISFDEKPDYDYLINLLLKEFNNKKFKNDNKFEWTTN